MKLFYTGRRGRPFRVAWLLEEAGVSYETVVVEGEARDGAEHRARQPLGRTPALELDDGTTMFDSTAIALQLADLYPQAGLVGAVGSQARADAYAWTLTAMTEFEPVRIRCMRGDDPADRERCGVADIVTGGVLQIAARVGTLDEQPRLAEYFGALSARPAFVTALQRIDSAFAPA